MEKQFFKGSIRVMVLAVLAYALGSCKAWEVHKKRKEKRKGPSHIGSGISKQTQHALEINEFSSQNTLEKIVKI